jgi:apolipoprotein N-acyltransferase
MAEPPTLPDRAPAHPEPGTAAPGRARTDPPKADSVPKSDALPRSNAQPQSDASPKSNAQPRSDASPSADAAVARPARRANLLHLATACAAGALNTLSFAPTPHGGWLELAVFALAFWLIARARSRGNAALTGGAFGFGNFVTGVWWLYVSMHHYGGMPAPMAGAALLLFCAYLALYPALAAALWHVFAGRDRAAYRPSWHASFAFASAWAISEWLRGTIFTGFPWLASGYPQVDGPLSGFAPIVGVYGIGWLVALVAALIVQAALRFAGLRAPQAARSALATNSALAASIAPLAVVAALLIVGTALRHVQWTTPSNAPLRVRLLQGNVPQSMKFDEVGVRNALTLYQRLITEKPVDLVVTPETAVPMLVQQIPDGFGSAVRHFIDQTGTAVLFGAVGATLVDGRPTDYTNALFGVTPGSRDLYRYDKHHLVPFGEFIPWGFRWFVDMMNIPLGDFARGAPVQPPFIVKGQPLALDICYEDIFGEEIARTLRGQQKPAGVLVNATNLAWFGDTIALDQHLQIARMRALETGRPMLRATNTGATAFIDADGSVRGRLPTYSIGALDVTVQGRAGMTPYIQAGNTTVLAVSLVLLVFGLVFGPARRRNGGA